MAKSPKAQLLLALEDAILGAFPQFRRYEEKSQYIWPGERVVVSHDLIQPATAFIVLVPNPKGYDEFTVELVWSQSSSFPELTQRPSGVPNQSEQLLSKAQASVRLFSLAEGAESWVAVSSASVEGHVRGVLSSLKTLGLPYLSRVKRVGAAGA